MHVTAALTLVSYMLVLLQWSRISCICSLMCGSMCQWRLVAMILLTRMQVSDQRVAVPLAVVGAKLELR